MTSNEQPNNWRDLKPCPFCGAEESDALVMNQDIYPGEDDGPDNHVWYVDCIECGANGGAHCDEAGAVENWNRRATPPKEALPAMINELQLELARMEGK